MLDLKGDDAVDLDVLISSPVGVLAGGSYLDIDAQLSATVAGSTKLWVDRKVRDLPWSGHATSYRVSRNVAAIEGLERHAGNTQRNDFDVVTAPMSGLADPFVDPRSLSGGESMIVGVGSGSGMFDESDPIEWVWGEDLGSRSAVLVPRRVAYYSQPVPGVSFPPDSSNGCATGSSLAEANLFGLLEVIERDAFLLSWYARARTRRISGAEGASARLAALFASARRVGYRINLFDARVDIPIPVVVAVADRIDDEPGTMAFAAAARLDPLQAMEAAAAEVATFAPLRNRIVTDNLDAARAMQDNFDLVTTLVDHQLLFGLPAARRYVSDYLDESDAASVVVNEFIEGFQTQAHELRSAEDATVYLVAHLEDRGLKPFFVEQTSNEQSWLGLRTTRVIVPGMLPLDFGWKNQRALTMPRLRTASFEAGMVSAPLSDADIRLVPHPFP